MRIFTSCLREPFSLANYWMIVAGLLLTPGLWAQDNCPTGTPEFFLVGPNEFCPGAAIELPIEGDEGVVYQWSGGAELGIPDGEGTGPVTGTAVLNDSGAPLDRLLTITGTAADGCSHTLRVELSVYARPIGQDFLLPVCAGAPFSIDLQAQITNGLASDFRYQLVNAEGLSYDGSGAGTTEALLTGAFDNETGELRRAVYAVTPFSEEGECAGDPFTVTVEVSPHPSGSAQAATVCSGAPADLVLAAAENTNAAVAFDVELLSISDQLSGTPTTGTALGAAALALDAFRNTSAVPGRVVYRVTPVSADGCRGRVFEVTLTVLPEPQIAAALQIAGVDFPSSGTCGHFNVIAQLLIENTGQVPLTDLSAGLNLGDPDQYGSAFQGMAPDGTPEVIESTAGVDPELVTGFAGSGELFVAGTGRLEPGQQLLLQFAFEVNPEAAGAPAAPQAQARVGGLADFSGLAGALDAPFRCPAEDLSDSGEEAAGTNPGAPGDTGGADDPTPLGDCWQLTRQVALNDQVLIPTDADCKVFLTADMLVENHFPACDRSVLPLGGYYRIFYQGEEVKGALDVSDNIDAVMAVEVRAVNNPCEPVLTFVTPEDKTPPSVTCPDDVVGLIRYVEEGQPAWRPTGDPAAAGPGESFHYLVCTDIDSIYRNDRSWKEVRYPYYTGIPEVVEACGASRIVDVRETLEEVDCNYSGSSPERPVANRLRRQFFYADDKGNVDSCEQIIYFFRPYLFLPDCQVTLDQCVYGDGADISPAAIDSAPYFLDGRGDTRLLTTHACGLTVDYEDQPLDGPENCGLKVVRTWTILDWCYGAEDYQPPVGRTEGFADCPDAPYWENKTLHYAQHLIIGDETPPQVSCPRLDYEGDGENDPITFSAGPQRCSAAVAPPPPLVEGECKDWSWEFDLYGYVYDSRRLQYDYVLIGTSTGGVLEDVATGEYDLVYLVTDACGNTAQSGKCTVLVRDDIAPVAKCDDQLNVSVGGGGVARVTAADVDEGSWDNCGPVDLHTRRSIEPECLDPYVMALAGGRAFAELEEVQNTEAGRLEYYDGEALLITLEAGTYWSRWDTLLYFTCCDISVDQEDRVRIELRATDRGANVNTCWMDILVEDKAGPVCDVRDASILCTDLDFDPSDAAQVSERFGSPEAVVLVLDNCGASITETLEYTPGDCGTGLIERNFSVTDASGITANCTQRITIEEVNQYSVRFPGDLERNECGADPVSDIDYESFACDLLAVDRDTTRFAASGEECFKQFVTYRVLNWCEYDGQSETPTEIRRDLDEDDDFREATWLEAGADPAFVSEYLPGEDASFLVQLFAAGVDGQREALPREVLLRADCPDGERHYGYRTYVRTDDGAYRLECSRSVDCSEAGLAAQCWTPGFYEYTQIVSVYDDEAPFIEVRNDDLEFCAFGNPEEDCGGRVHIVFDLLDHCTPDDVELRNLRLLPNGDPAQVITIDDGIFALDRAGNQFTLSGQLPVGRHRFLLQAFDGCGNLAGLTIDFSVVDCKAPAPICINGITAELMPVDEDGDGTPDTGMNVIEASDYIASPLDDCAGEVTYSINWRGEPVDREQNSLVVNCDFPLYETLPVEVHAWDAEGNHDFCETFVIIQDFQELCAAESGGTIAGLVHTEEDEAIEGVRIQLSGRASRAQRTAADGLYRFGGLEEGYDYSVQASVDEDEDPLNGVSTFDLIQISKHILGVKRLESPYQLLAADINDSGAISTLDLIQLRKLILGVSTGFSNNRSWRFLPGALAFADPEQPWTELDAMGGGANVINLNNLSGAVADADFIGVKIGDVNGNARVNRLQEADVRNMAGAFTLWAADEDLRAGDTYVIDLTGAAMDRIQGLQFTLSYDRQRLELQDLRYGLATAEHLAVFAGEDLLTVSWNAPVTRVPDATEAPLFSLVFRAAADGPLSEALQVNSRRTRAEAYDLNDEALEVRLRFEGSSTAGFALYQNQPNPFREETLIGFELPAAGEAILRVHDVNGRLLQQHRGIFNKGYNEVRLDQGQLPSGVLYYTLETGRHTATRKMVRIE